MIFGKLITLLLFLIAVYYITIFFHLIGAIKLTNKELSLSKSFIPFWYWISLFYTKDKNDEDKNDEDKNDEDKNDEDNKNNNN